MYWLFMAINVVCIAVGFASVFLNLKPGLLQLGFFAVALCMPAVLSSYGSSTLVALMFVLALIGVAMAGAQVLGFVHFGAKGTVPF
jgi:hypothetical protein